MSNQQKIMLMDARGVLVAEIELPPTYPTPEVIHLHDGRSFARQIDMRIYKAVSCYIVGTHSKALIDEHGKLAWPEKMGHDANPFGRKIYESRKNK